MKHGISPTTDERAEKRRVLKYLKQMPASGRRRKSNKRGPYRGPLCRARGIGSYDEESPQQGLNRKRKNERR